MFLRFSLRTFRPNTTQNPAFPVGGSSRTPFTPPPHILVPIRRHGPHPLYPTSPTYSRMSNFPKTSILLPFSLSFLAAVLPIQDSSNMLKTRKVPRLYIIHNAVASYPNFDAFEAAMQESPSISRTEFLCKIEHAGVLEMPQGIGNYDAVRPIQTPAAWLWVKSEERCNFGNSAYHLTVLAQRERVRKTMKKERPQRDRQKPKRERGGGILRRKRVVRSPNAPEKAMIFGVSVTTKKYVLGEGACGGANAIPLPHRNAGD